MCMALYNTEKDGFYSLSSILFKLNKNKQENISTHRERKESNMIIQSLGKVKYLSA